MRRAVVFFALWVLLIAAACSLPGSVLDGGSSAPPELATVFDTPADPVHVSAVVDSSRSVEVTMTANGGSISATGADGTLYRLDIPPGALASDTLIRMTPVSTIDGMPFGSQPIAVQLEPEGLQFYQFANLTITPAQAIPVDQQIFFGYQGLGENLTLAPPVVGSDEIKFWLDHFSGYGVTKGLLADIEPVRARIGGTAEARIRSAVAAELMKARQAALLGQEYEMPDFQSFFQQYEDEVVKPRLAAAGQSCAAGRLAIETLLGFERQKQLLGIGTDDVTGLMDNGLMDTVMSVCMKEEFELCRDEHIIHRIIPAWLGMERQLQLLGVEGSTAALDQARTYVQQCLTFELQFHSEAQLDQGPDGYISVVDATIKLQFDTGQMKITATAPLVNTEFEQRLEFCTTENHRGGDTFTVIDLGYISDTRSAEDALGYVRDMNLIYYPGNTKESFTVDCDDDAPPFTSPPAPMWTGIYLVLHEKELSEAAGGFIATEWEIIGDEYFAKKEWILEEPGENIFEAGTLKLYHRPGR